MARVSLASAVYLGDVAPYIPVARRLAAAGHEVTFVAPEGFRSLLEPEPFAFHPYGLDSSPAAMHADPEHNRLMEHPFRNTARLGAYWHRRTIAEDPDAALASLEAGFAGADVVVSHPTMCSVTIPVARSVGAAVVTGQLFPMMIPTRHWTPPLGSRSLRLPQPVNRATWGALRQMTRRAFGDALLNEVRARYGLPPIVANAGWAWLEADTTVLLVSRHYYGPEAPDWPPVRWGGFSVWEGPAGQQLDADLVSYLDAGEPPVLVMLGTSAATGAGAVFAAVAAGLAARGLRSVLLVGDHANLAHVADHPAARTFAPVTELLPRCRAAVVSGALGGVAAALTAGVPTVVHPQLFDQLWHGRRVEQLGVGRLARRARHVAPAVAEVVDDPACAARARELGARLSAEDGAAVLADAALEQVG
jgi:UDP:flavonoid glycosyltransferase YjiC (YdhE family)